MPQFTQEQLWQKYSQLPPELKHEIWSERVSEIIYDASKTNESLDNVVQIADCVGDVLLGISNPENFEENLTRAGVDKEAAQKITQTVDRAIFNPVKYLLAKLKATPSVEAGKPVIPAAPKRPQTKFLGRQDVYREKVLEEEKMPRFKGD